MVDINSKTEQVRVNVSSVGNKGNVSFIPTQNYYDGLARQWAISENIVNGEDYSSKHYANESKKQANLATEKATIATNKVNEVIESGNEALSKISAQETTSKNIVKAEGETQVARVKAEGANYATKAEATYTAGDGISIENNVISNTQTSAEWGNIQGNIQSQNDLIEFVNSKGSGLELCDIGTALYVDETKGLRRRLNGQIVGANANTQGFIDKLVKIKALAPSLFDTEENWQTTKTMSKLGQCGKFVLNYGSDGVTITSVRLPAVVNINGLIDMAKCGLIKDESLPNVKGDSNMIVTYTNPTGAFYSVEAGNQAERAHAQGGVSFDASRSSSTYQDNAPVQQEAIQYPYFIQIATGQETENNIKDTLELNNPFTFGMNMYFKGEMKNVSWLKSSGQQNTKALHPDFYNWVLTNANAGKDGFKLSTASDITDYDFEVNPTNETFRLPLKNGMEGVFTSGVKGNGIALGLTDGTNEGGVFEGTDHSLHAKTKNTGVPVGSTTSQVSDLIADKTVGLTTDPTKSGIVVDTTVPSGYNLYYYVGETVQNSNLIDAGRIAEELGNKLDKPPRYVVEVSDKSLMPSWYMVYNDGWCEQGCSKVPSYPTWKTITLLKPYKDTNYQLLTSCNGNVDGSSAWTTNTDGQAYTKNQIQIKGTNADSNWLMSWKTAGYIR